MTRRYQISGNSPSECSLNLRTFLRHVPRTKRSQEQQGHGTNSAYRRWCGRCGSSSAFLTLIMILGKEIFSRPPIPSASELVSLGLSHWFSRERYPFHYTIFFRQIGPAFRQFAPASRQVTSAIGRRGILSLTLCFPTVPHDRTIKILGAFFRDARCMIRFQPVHFSIRIQERMDFAPPSSLVYSIPHCLFGTLLNFVFCQRPHFLWRF